MARHGKIARLPHDLREELNRRLLDGEPGGPLRAWLNALPAVQALLARHFGGAPISKQNLCEWRAGGFAEWQLRQDTLAPARGLAAEATQLAAAADGRLTDHLATVLAARYAAAVVGWNGEMTEPFSRKLRTLRGLFQAIVALRRGDLTGARLNLEQDRRARERKILRLPPEPPVEAGLAGDGSNPVKPGQTEINPVFFGLAPDPPPPAAPTVSASNPAQPDPPPASLIPCVPEPPASAAAHGLAGIKLERHHCLGAGLAPPAISPGLRPLSALRPGRRPPVEAAAHHVRPFPTGLATRGRGSASSRASLKMSVPFFAVFAFPLLCVLALAFPPSQFLRKLRPVAATRAVTMT